MKTKDVSLIPTASYQLVSVLTPSDTDHSINDIETVWQAVTISNLSDVDIEFKSTSKNVTPTLHGRILRIGESIFYSAFDSKRCYMRTLNAGTISTGAVILSGDQ